MEATVDTAAAPAPAAMAHEAEIMVPGSFVVLQGIPGDGLSNTIDTAPFLMEDYDHILQMQQQEEEGSSSTFDFHHVSTCNTTRENDVISYEDSSSEEEGVQRQIAALGTSPRSPMLMGGYNSLIPGGGAAAPAMTPLVLHPAATATTATTATTTTTTTSPSRRRTTDDQFEFVADDAPTGSSPSNSEDDDGRDRPKKTTLTRAQLEAMEHWENECRNREIRDRKEWLQNQEEPAMWWQSQGRLAIFAELPKKDSACGNGVQTTQRGSLAPGCTLVGTQLVTLDSHTWQPLKEETTTTTISRKGVVQLLKIESPREGWVVLSLDGYGFLGPGLPSMYTDPRVWVWRVTCLDGAYVREGLELTSTHVETLPYGSLLRVSRKTVNSMGLSRLRVHARLHRQTQQRVEGWVSQSLNPLSGQRGPIVQPVPFPVPALYRVTLPAGAVIRSNVELSSSQIGHAPAGAVLQVVGRAFSETPMDQCIERFQLAGCGGWVSIRLNRPAPHDEWVMQAVGIDGSFDPERPGVFHLEAHERVRAEQDGDHHHHEDEDAQRQGQTAQQQQQPTQHDLYRRIPSTLSRGDLSSINEEEDDDQGVGGGRGGNSDLSSSSSSVVETTTSAATGTAVPILFRSGVSAGGGSVRSGSKGRHGRHSLLTEERCLICLTEERNATIVHGETGHIACCLACARILKARGDRCPVCRLPIDSVIQQFWA